MIGCVNDALSCPLGELAEGAADRWIQFHLETEL